MVDDRAGVPTLATDAAGVSRGVRQRHSPGPLVWLAVTASPVGGIERHPPGNVGAMAADRGPVLLARGGGAGQRYPLGSGDTRFLNLEPLGGFAQRGQGNP